MHECVDMFMCVWVYIPVFACMCRLVYIALQRPRGGDQVTHRTVDRECGNENKKEKSTD